MVAVTAPESPTTEHWWHRRRPSTWVFLLVLGAIGVLAASTAKQVTSVLPEVAKDQLGEDRWAEPLGVEEDGEFTVGHVPDCAVGPITRIVLWDADSKAYWEVAGPAKPLTDFVVGVTPDGFLPVVPFEKPPSGAVLRLIVFRSIGGAAGIRYTGLDLKPNRVISGRPLTSYTLEGFRTALVCSTSAETSRPGAAGDPAATTVPGDLVAPAGTPTPTSVPG